MKKVIKSDEEIISLIHFIRGRKVMLDSDLARIYGVATRRMNEQVKRNIQRFPKDFMFQLTPDEFQILMSQIATSSLHVTENIQEEEKRTFEKLEEHAEQLILVFEALRDLVKQKEEPREPVGFKIGNRDKS